MKTGNFRISSVYIGGNTYRCLYTLRYSYADCFWFTRVWRIRKYTAVRIIQHNNLPLRLHKINLVQYIHKSFTVRNTNPLTFCDISLILPFNSSIVRVVMELIGRNMWGTTVSEPDILEVWLAGVWKRRRMRWNLEPQVRKMRWPPALLRPELSRVAASITSSWLEITSFCSPQLTVELVRLPLVLRINREKETNCLLPVHIQSMSGQDVAFEYSLFLCNINKWAST